MPVATNPYPPTHEYYSEHGFGIHFQSENGRCLYNGFDSEEGAKTYMKHEQTMMYRNFYEDPDQEWQDAVVVQYW